MRKLTALLLSVIMAFTLTSVNAERAAILDPSDPGYLQMVCDGVMASAEVEFASEDYTIEAVEAVFISQEYIDELAYNSQANVFFGYTIEEVDAMFEGERYVFTLGSDGETTVRPFEAYDASMNYQQLLTNVAVGAGVILVCVVVSVATSGAGAPATVAFIHAVSASALEGAVLASAKGAVVGAATAGLRQWNETGDFEASMRAAAMGASDGFKYGAIVGGVTGAVEGAVEYLTHTQIDISGPEEQDSDQSIPSWRESEEYAQAYYAREGYEVSPQVSYQFGEEVSRTTTGASRPDLVIRSGGEAYAVEVKNYDLVTNRSQLGAVLTRELGARNENLPEGMMQRVLLDTRGRGYSPDIINEAVAFLGEYCSGVYPDLIIDVLY